MISKAAFICAALAAVHAHVVVKTPLVSTSLSDTSRKQNVHGNYAFGYEIVDKHGASNSRSEVGDGYGNKKGTYTIHDIDGRARRVDYVADKLGFRAAVTTNEPGTAHSTPAAVTFDSPFAGPSIDHIAPVATAVTEHVSLAADSAPVVYASDMGHDSDMSLGDMSFGYGESAGYGFDYGNDIFGPGIGKY